MKPESRDALLTAISNARRWIDDIWLGRIAASLKDADFVLALDVDVPWAIGPDAPPDDAFVAIVDIEPSKRRIPTMEFTADLRLAADSLSTIEMLETEAMRLISAADRLRFEARARRLRTRRRAAAAPSSRRRRRVPPRRR